MQDMQDRIKKRFFFILLIMPMLFFSSFMSRALQVDFTARLKLY